VLTASLLLMSVNLVPALTRFTFLDMDSEIETWSNLVVRSLSHRMADTM
jgi:hypothetical protein